MTTYIPHLLGYEFYFGEQYDRGMATILQEQRSFLRVASNIIANKLAFYYIKSTNSASQLPLIVNIIISEINLDYWMEPIYGLNPITVATNVNIPQLLSGKEGWKWLDISSFNFQANKVYIVEFEVVSITPINNGLDNLFYVGLTDKILPPYASGVPPEGTPSYHLTQTKNNYGSTIDSQSTSGNYSFNPIAVALSDEDIPIEEPTPEPATLNLDTTPVKGEIFLNGISQGIAPVALSVDEGIYTISFGDVSGWTKPQPQTITVYSGETKNIVGKYTEIPTEPPPEEPPKEEGISLLAVLGILAAGIVGYQIFKNK